MIPETLSKQFRNVPLGASFVFVGAIENGLTAPCVKVGKAEWRVKHSLERDPRQGLNSASLTARCVVIPDES